MMALASAHGLNGVRMVLEDYLRRPLAVVVLRMLIAGTWIGAMIVAVYVILAS